VYYGYLIVTLLYLIIGIVLYVKRKEISDSITNMMFQEKEPENDTDNE
jgi:hypothetical protein